MLVIGSLMIWLVLTVKIASSFTILDNLKLALLSAFSKLPSLMSLKQPSPLSSLAPCNLMVARKV